MRSSRVVRVSDCQCQSRNSPGFDPSILLHSGVWGAADKTVLNTVHRKKLQKISLLKVSNVVLGRFFFLINLEVQSSRHKHGICTFMYISMHIYIYMAWIPLCNPVLLRSPWIPPNLLPSLIISMFFQWKALFPPHGGAATRFHQKTLGQYI